MASPRSADDWKRFNTQVIEEFRSNGGRVERFGDLSIIVLHTIGARSAEVREIPLIVVDEAGETMVYGTAEGAPNDPAWVHNLRANPAITVELGAETFEAVFDELSIEEARAVVGARAAYTPQLAEYIERAKPRPIPVFRIRC